jgi:hypothetical protein
MDYFCFLKTTGNFLLETVGKRCIEDCKKRCRLWWWPVLIGEVPFAQVFKVPLYLTCRLWNLELNHKDPVFLPFHFKDKKAELQAVTTWYSFCLEYLPQISAMLTPSPQSSLWCKLTRDAFLDHPMWQRNTHTSFHPCWMEQVYPDMLIICLVYIFLC